MKKYNVLFCAILFIMGVCQAQVMTGASQVARAKGVENNDRITGTLFVFDSTDNGEYSDCLLSLSEYVTSALNKNGFGVSRPEYALGIAERVDNKKPDRAMITQVAPEGAIETIADATNIQMARDMGMDCIFSVAISSVTIEEIIAGMKNVVLDISLNAYGTARGDGTYGDTISVEMKCTDSQWTKNKKAFLAKMLKKASEESALSFAAGLKKLNIYEGRPANVTFKCKVPATIKVDGMAMGTANTEIKMESGMHTIQVEYPFCKQYIHRARFVDGQVYEINLKLTDEGIARYKSLQEYAIALQKTKTEMKHHQEHHNVHIESEKVDIEIKKNDPTLKHTENMYKMGNDHEENILGIKMGADVATVNAQAQVKIAEAQIKANEKLVDAQIYVMKKDADGRYVVSEGESEKLSNSYEQIKEHDIHVRTESIGDNIKTVESDADNTNININK